MAGNDQGAEKRINAVLEAVRKSEKGKKVAILQAFVAEYFSQVPAQDLAGLGAK